MVEKRPINWYDGITEYVHMFNEGTIGMYIVSTDKLRHMLEEYDVDAMSMQGDKIIIYIHLMSFDQIDLLMSYKPSFFINGMFHKVIASSSKDIYVLQKILENDVEFKCVTSKVICGRITFDNLLCFLDTYYSHIPNLMMDVRLQSDPVVREYILLTNHTKKWISLFDMMKPILEESDKRRRFQ